MPKFRFTKNFDHKPTSQTTVGYLAGYEGMITTAAAEAAIKAKAGEIIEKDVEPAKTAPKANG